MTASGNHLGPVGGRIVAEVIIGCWIEIRPRYDPQSRDGGLAPHCWTCLPGCGSRVHGHSMKPRILSRCDPNARGTWADLGTGNGTFTRALVNLVGPRRIYAVDSDARAMAELMR